jgi:peptide deformylase
MIMPDRIIQKYGSPVLRQKAEPVGDIDAGIVRTLKDMFDTMHHHSGLGLAGNQIGVLQRLMVLTNLDTGEDLALINPEIISNGSEKELGEEGCLSIPEVFGKVNRYRKIEVKALNVHGKEIILPAENLLARVLQHEIDHLDGVLFIDRLSPTRRLVLTGRLSKISSVGDN